MSASDGRAWLAIALAAGVAGCSAAPLGVHGEIAHPVTRDGWPLTVEHFRASANAPKRPRPVVLCHGVLANHRFWELEGDGSLPIVLANDGFDVWVVDMRGRPDAGAPGYWLGAHTYDYDVDAFARDDMDAILGYVVAQTQARDVAWVGHSLGGMIAYARLGTMGDARIGALVTVGSPGFFAPASKNLVQFYKLSRALALLPALPVSGPAAIDAKLHLPIAPSMLKSTILETSNLPDETYRRLEENGVNDGAKPELRQLLLSIRRGEFVSADGSVSYTQALSAIRTPALVIVGRADELADPLVGRGVYERLGSPDKSLVVAGKAEGFGVDYGHVDLVVGPAARREIFPRILAWLEAHPGS